MFPLPQARCPHLGVPMAGAKVEKGAITCSQHKSRWACATGAVEEWLPGGGVNAMQRLISPPCGLAEASPAAGGQWWQCMIIPRPHVWSNPQFPPIFLLSVP